MTEKMTSPWDLSNLNLISRYSPEDVKLPLLDRVVNSRKSVGIKRRTVISNTEVDQLSRYEVSLFGEDFDFISFNGLIGAQIYGICEDIYTERN